MDNRRSKNVGNHDSRGGGEKKLHEQHSVVHNSLQDDSLLEDHDDAMWGLGVDSKIIKGLLKEVRLRKVETTFEELACRHHMIFQDLEEGEEQSLAAMEIFQAFERSFESLVADYLEAEQISPEEFCRECRKILDIADDPGNGGMLLPNDAKAVRMLLSLLDYEEFVKLMKIECASLDVAEAAADDMGL